jgi:hypothetical protein
MTGGASELDYKNALQRGHYTHTCLKSHYNFQAGPATKYGLVTAFLGYLSVQSERYRSVLFTLCL